MINGVIVGIPFAISLATLVDLVFGLIFGGLFILILPLFSTALYRISIYGYEKRNISTLGFFDKINLIMFSFVFLIPATFIIIGRIDTYLSGDAQNSSPDLFNSHLNS